MTKGIIWDNTFEFFFLFILSLVLNFNCFNSTTSILLQTNTLAGGGNQV